MNKKKKCYLSYLALTCLCLTLQAQKQWTLEDCIRHALNNNTNIKKQKIAHRQSETNYDFSKFSFLPELSGNISQEFNFGRNTSPENNQYTNLNTSTSSFSFSVSIPLSDQLLKFKSYKINRLDLKASQFDVKQAQEDITLQVISAFLKVIYYRELIVISQTQTQLSGELYNKTKQLKEFEVSSKLDVLNAKSQYAQDQYTLVQVKNEHEQAFALLTQLLNIPSNVKFDISIPKNVQLEDGGVPSLDKIYNSVLNNNPRIIAEQYRLKKNLEYISLAKMNILPTLSLQIGIHTGYYSIDGLETYTFQQQWKNNLNKSVIFNLSIPIFNQLSRFKNIRDSKYQMMNQKLVLEEAEQYIQKEVQDIYLRILASYKKINASEFAKEAAEELYTKIYERYSLGCATIYEYNEAKTKWLKAQFEYTQAKYEYMFNMKILQYYQK